MQKRFNPLKPDTDAPKPRPIPLKKGTIPNPIPVGPAPVLTENEERDGLELRFAKRPGPAVLEFFHSTKDLPSEQRWYFHFKGKYWYAKRNDATRKFAAMLIAHASETSPAPEPNIPQEVKPAAFMPSVLPPEPFVVEWQKQTDQGLTRLPYDVWIENYVEAAGDTHPEKSEPEPEPNPTTIVPVSFKPKAPVWRSRFNRSGAWCPPVPTDSTGNPSRRY